LLMLLVVAGVGALTMQRIQQQVDKAEATARIQKTLSGASSARLQYQATFDEQHLQDNEAQLKEMTGHIATARELDWNPDELAMLDAMSSRVDAYRAQRQEMAERRRARVQTRANW